MWSPVWSPSSWIGHKIIRQSTKSWLTERKQSFNLPAKKRIRENEMKWELLHTKHTWGLWKTFPQDVVDLVHYWSSIISWVNLMQENPAEAITYKRLRLSALTLTFTVVSDTLETYKWVLNLKETFPFVVRVGETNSDTSNNTSASEPRMFSMNWISWGPIDCLD